MEPARWVPGALCVLLSVGVAAVAGAECSKISNATCEECLKNVTCFWCSTNQKCEDYPVKNILPPSSLCKLSDARWGVCWVNFEALIITMSVVGGILVISLIVCCCCCCRKKRTRSHIVDDEKTVREKTERRARQEERRTQMKTRHDEIRKKYGNLNSAIPKFCSNFGMQSTTGTL
ncbi:hypothetical protein FKM82_016081 [Ascaphus truei]